MKNSGLYSFGPDGTLWTLINPLHRRPSTAEELEGYCREMGEAVHHLSPKTKPPPDQLPMPVAV